MIDCRLIIDEPAEGAWNMAVDEALLDSVAQGAPATLRVYRWAEPTLSLGYFQSYADRDAHTPSRKLPCVRRSSGGGALVHDQEVTYSLALPAAVVSGRETRALYCEAHRAVIDTIAELGGDCSRFTLCEPSTEGAGEEPFLCFQRRADGDLLVAAPPVGAMDSFSPDRRYKVGGSAQRRRRGALLQHGGVLLAGSHAAPELPGLRELAVEVGNLGDFGRQLASFLAKRLKLQLQQTTSSETEISNAKRLQETKYSQTDWLEKR